ncbi:response regulator [Diaphorobacter ruginosibacter]|uniref:Response regulator n=1 Tax=Diaphorobacter ruginosibacter TaxID=1715720 RepID=A0A7G9RTK3_9BURK|nr:response regulator [Diaphorobacter ruginosibacter]QNN58928.1 response regulator [Diaphorobacter ruginosibacter]
MRILLIEDEMEMASWLMRALRQSHIAVEHAPDARLAKALIAGGAFDVVVLDLQLPDQHGFELLREIREQGHHLPVLILTAQGSLQDRVEGLHRGADDYLTKPFEMPELEARLVALHRRSQGRSQAHIQCASLRFDGNHQTFWLNHSVLSLTPREHSALEVLISRVGAPVGKSKLAAKVFPQDSMAGPDAIEQVLHRVRRKLQGSDVHIVTVRGLGYMLEPLPASPSREAATT